MNPDIAREIRQRIANQWHQHDLNSTLQTFPSDWPFSKLTLVQSRYLQLHISSSIVKFSFALPLIVFFREGTPRSPNEKLRNKRFIQSDNFYQRFKVKGEGWVRQSLGVSDLPIITKNNLSYLKFEWDNNVDPNSAKSSDVPSVKCAYVCVSSELYRVTSQLWA